MMRYVSVNYNYSPDYSTPESWFKRTEGYAGILEELSKENMVFNIKQINYEGNCVHNGIQYRFVSFKKKVTYFPLQLNRYVKNLNPDVVIIQGFHKPLQLIQLSLILDKKTKIIVHNHAEKPLTGKKRYFQKVADKFVDAYLFASKQMGLDWVKKGNISSDEKIHEVMEVSSLFYPIKKATARLRTGVADASVFLWVGRLNDNKDPLNVVRGFLKFAAANPTSVLYMIYHTDELLNDIKKLLKNNPAGDRVILVGSVPHYDLLYWFNSADFFISGSHYEGSGTALCEAMSCGCVSVVTDIPSFKMITDNGACGILYEPGSEAGLLLALKQTKSIDITEKQKLAIEYFKSNLSFEAIAQKINGIAVNL